MLIQIALGLFRMFVSSSSALFITPEIPIKEVTANEPIIPNNFLLKIASKGLRSNKKRINQNCY